MQSRASSAHLGLREKRKRFWAVSAQQAASQHAERDEPWRRHADLNGSRPTGSLERGGEIPLRSGRPPLDSSEPAGTGRSTIEIGSRSRDRVYTGSTRAPIPIAVLRGLSAQTPRKHLPPALSRTKPMGASGQDRWQQRPCLRTRQRSKASRPADASGAGEHSSHLCLRPAQRPEPARRNRPSVTTGRLLTRETLRRVRHDRGRSCERGPSPHDPCDLGAERHLDGSETADMAAGAETA
jgi:hypothetical protein